MKKTSWLVATIIVLNIALSSNVDASVIKGKRYYIKLLKASCGFKGDVMGRYHTKLEWRNAYRSGKLNETIKQICPTAPDIKSKKKLKNIYHFLSSFASDSGNVPSCN